MVLLGTSVWIVLLYTAVTCHITIICVTLFLHRYQAHRGVKIRGIASIPMRFWLWISTAMKTKEWVAVHRKHHAFTDHDGDPHSPARHGVWAIVFAGVWYYRRALRDRVILEQFGKGTPEDWLERNLFERLNLIGVFALLLIDAICVGPLAGLIVWSVQMLWIPFWGAGVVNGLGHALGYRNHQIDDRSRNILPFGLLLGGEELHNNHHKAPASPKFSSRWWEIDLGWYYIQFMRLIGLAKLSRAT